MKSLFKWIAFGVVRTWRHLLNRKTWGEVWFADHWIIWGRVYSLPAARAVWTSKGYIDPRLYTKEQMAAIESRTPLVKGWKKKIRRYAKRKCECKGRGWIGVIRGTKTIVPCPCVKRRQLAKLRLKPPKPRRRSGR